MFCHHGSSLNQQLVFFFFLFVKKNIVVYAPICKLLHLPSPPPPYADKDHYCCSIISKCDDVVLVVLCGTVMTQHIPFSLVQLSFPLSSKFQKQWGVNWEQERKHEATPWKAVDLFIFIPPGGVQHLHNHRS